MPAAGPPPQKTGPLTIYGTGSVGDISRMSMAPDPNAPAGSLAKVLGYPGLLGQRTSIGEARRKGITAGLFTGAIEGDSLTEGYDATAPGGSCPNSGLTCQGATIPGVLQQALIAAFAAAGTPIAVSVANRGWSGQTAAQGLVQWAAAPFTHFCCWMYGYNDGTFSTVAVYRATLAAWIERKIAAGTVPIVCGSPAWNNVGAWENVRDYIEAARDVASLYGVLFVDLDEVSRSVVERWQGDFQHPNVACRTAMGWGLAAAICQSGGHGTKRVAAGMQFVNEDYLGVGGDGLPLGDGNSPSVQLRKVAANNALFISVFCETDLIPVVTTFNSSAGTDRPITFNFEGVDGKVLHNLGQGVFRQSGAGLVMKRGYRVLMLKAGAIDVFVESIKFVPAKPQGNRFDGYGPTQPFTCAITPGSGAFGNAQGIGGFVRQGNLVFATLTASITTNGSAAGVIYLDLPFVAAGPATFVGQNLLGSPGELYFGTIKTGESRIMIQKADGTYPGASGRIIALSGVFEAIADL